jgi:hypothetical protein
MEKFIQNAKEKKSTSYISYAALEGRIAIERIEFELLAIGSQKYLTDEWLDLIRGYKGIDKANSRYKSLKFKVQSYTEAFASVFTELPLKAFEFRKASDYESKLADYLHLYYRSNEELIFENEFMQKGILLIEEVISFLNSLFVKFQNNYIFGVVDISTLMNGAEIVFQKWLINISNDIEIVIYELSKLKETAKGESIVSIRKCDL